MIKHMAEFDSILLFNPIDEDFVHNFNGEPYTLPAKGSKAFSKFVAFHLAKHLATKLVTSEIKEVDKKKNASITTQRIVYDNPYLRIALYKILKDVKIVQEVVQAYPYKGFVGEMEIYQTFVEKTEASTKQEKETSDEESAPSSRRPADNKPDATNGISHDARSSSN